MTMNSLLSTAALAAALVAPVAAANNSTNIPDNSSRSAHLELVKAEAKKVHKEANEIALHLKSKNVDFTLVREKIDTLDSHVASLTKLVHDLEPEATSWTSAQKAQYDRLKLTAEILNVFVNNKKTLLGEDAGKNRSMLRAKALGVAKRAEILLTEAAKIRG